MQITVGMSGVLSACTCSDIRVSICKSCTTALVSACTLHGHPSFNSLHQCACLWGACPPDVTHTAMPVPGVAMAMRQPTARGAHASNYKTWAQCIRDGKSIIMEGLHLDPGLYLYEFGRYGQAHLLEGAGNPRASPREAEAPRHDPGPESTASAAAREGAARWRPVEARACAAAAAEGGLAGVGRGRSGGSSRPPAHAGGSSLDAKLAAERGVARAAAPFQVQAALRSDGMSRAPGERTGVGVTAGVSAGAKQSVAEQRSGNGAHAQSEASVLQCALVTCPECTTVYSEAGSVWHQAR